MTTYLDCVRRRGRVDLSYNYRQHQQASITSSRRDDPQLCVDVESAVVTSGRLLCIQTLDVIDDGDTLSTSSYKRKTTLPAPYPNYSRRHAAVEDAPPKTGDASKTGGSSFIVGTEVGTVVGCERSVPPKAERGA